MFDIKFCKLQASGNDFILIDRRRFLGGKKKSFLAALARKICARKKGIGADGLLFIEPSKKYSFKMRIFNADGSEAQMCGNGARCAALWYFIKNNSQSKELKFDTKAGVISASLRESIKVSKNLTTAKIKVKITEPVGFREDLPVKVLGRKIKVNFINTGVPHLVIFVGNLESLDVEGIGRAARFNPLFRPEGANVNFVNIKGKNNIQVRTYERGVEAETLACGTGSVASALVYFLKTKRKSLSKSIKVETRGGQTLTVSFNWQKGKIRDVWLEGRASFIYQGSLNQVG